MSHTHTQSHAHVYRAKPWQGSKLIKLTAADVQTNRLQDWGAAVLMAIGGAASASVCWCDGWMCVVTRINCSPQCDDRCYGTQANQCCHPECAGGCDGPTKNDCWVCVVLTCSLKKSNWWFAAWCICIAQCVTRWYARLWLLCIVSSHLYPSIPINQTINTEL